MNKKSKSDLKGGMAPNPAKPQAGTSKKPIQEAIVFIERAAIRPVLRQEIKQIGIPTLYNVESIQSCLEHLGRYPRAMLVVDWDHGDRFLSQILAAAQGAFSCDTRAIFLIAPEVNLPLVAMATEYHVSRIHTGEISRGAIQAHMDAIMTEESDEQSLRVQLSRVAEARSRGNVQSAGQILAELMIRFPGNSRIGCELAEHLIQEDSWDKASALVDMLLAIDQNNLRTQHLKARCLMHEGKFEDASAVLINSNIINPFNVERLVDLGQAFIQSDRIKEALATFDEVLSLDMSNKAAHLGRAQCRLLEGDVNEALGLMRQISTPREMASLFNNSAILSIRQNRFDQGLSLYKAAIGAVGSKERIISRLLYNLGIAQYKNSKLEEALECFEVAFKRDPSYTKAKLNASAVAYKLGRKPALGHADGITKQRSVDEAFTEVFDDEQMPKTGTKS